MGGMPCMPMHRTATRARPPTRELPSGCLVEPSPGDVRWESGIEHEFRAVLLIPLAIAMLAVAMLAAETVFSAWWLGLAMLLPIGLSVAAARRSSRAQQRTRARSVSPDQLLRVRFASGEITRQQYQDALVDILKDRYIRGEIELNEFDDRLTRLLAEPRPLPVGERD